MKYDCGLTKERPTLSPTYRWVRTAPIRSMPQSVAVEWRTLFVTPGFTYNFLMRYFRITQTRMDPLWIDAKNHREALMPQITENWLSITREDNILIAAHRPKWATMPLCVRMQIADDMKTGEYTQPQLATIYGVHWRTVQDIVKNGPLSGIILPDWFNPALF